MPDMISQLAGAGRNPDRNRLIKPSNGDQATGATTTSGTSGAKRNILSLMNSPAEGASALGNRLLNTTRRSGNACIEERGITVQARRIALVVPMFVGMMTTINFAILEYMDSTRAPSDIDLRAILESALGRRSMPLNIVDSTPLLGSIPELDSMAVLTILTQIQEDLGCEITDDEVDASIFETFGSLRRFIDSKLV